MGSSSEHINGCIFNMKKLLKKFLNNETAIKAAVFLFGLEDIPDTVSYD